LKKYVPVIVVNVLLLLAFFACLIAFGSIRGVLRSQQAARAWAGQSGERFSQISAFLSEGFDLDEETLYNLRASIDKELVAASLEADGGRVLYTDAWSAAGEVLVSGGRGSESVRAYGVGGNFFLFHPLYLRDGSYLSPGDLMKDRVVLDEELAWLLFGSVHVAGLEVTVGDRPHLIAGVVSRESDFASSRAYTGGAGMFMSFESLREQAGGEVRINTYEIVMPDPITGFAFQALTDVFPDGNAHIVENSARYSLSSIFGVIGSFGERSMRADVMTYPYWENAARFTEDWLALLLVLKLVFITCPVVCSVIYGVKGIRFVVMHCGRTIKRIADEHDDRKAEKYLL
jgi:hypothetical protein